MKKKSNAKPDHDGASEVAKLLTINVNANGKKIRTNIVVVVILIFSVVSGLIMLERFGVLDDVKNIISAVRSK